MDQFTTLKKTLSRRCPGLELREQEPLSRHTSFRIGGPARLMALPVSELEAERAVQVAASLGIVPIYIGNGTNLLVSDQGIDAFVVKAFDGLSRLERIGETGIRAGSGVLLSKLASFAQSQGLAGLEFAHGIPGSVGGAVTMNAGAYGGEMQQVVKCTEFLTADGARDVLEGGGHLFRYRHSAFSDGTRLLLNTSFTLEQGNSDQIRQRMLELAAKRKEKQPLEYPSAGSTFKRPEGYFAAALIEQRGLKGAAEGGAQVSEKHAGFIINRGGATCADVLRLVERVQETVLKETGIRLELEVKTLGF